MTLPKDFNKWFSTILMASMVVVISITTGIKLGQPDARPVMLIIAALGSVMGIASTVLSANGIIWTFLFGILDVVFCCTLPYTFSTSFPCSSWVYGSGKNAGQRANRR